VNQVPLILLNVVSCSRQAGQMQKHTVRVAKYNF